MTNKENIFKKR